MKMDRGLTGGTAFLVGALTASLLWAARPHALLQASVESVAVN